jgi:hypothetical protein
MGISISGLKVGHKEFKDGYEQFANGPDSVGGIGVQFSFRNEGEKTIKYVTISFIPYNQVGDAVSSSIGGRSEFGIICTGPIAPNKKQSGRCECIWYNYSITSVRVSKAEIEYMDGTTEVIDGTNIPVEEGGGCYVATAVYGSYDCPEVWTLRRYRDYELAETWHGRLFIKAYYAISPTIVKWFGDTAWFKKMWKGKLDRMVSNLQQKGFENTPYEDRKW